LFIPGDVRIANRFQLLALFVKVAALQPQRARHIRHVKIVTSNFSQQHFFLKSFGSLGQRSRRSTDVSPTAFTGHHSRWAKSFLHLQRSLILLRQQNQPLYHIAEFAHIPANHIAAAPRSHRR